MSRGGRSWEALLTSYPDSVKINAVSPLAETLYTRLIACSDKAGHFWGDAKMIALKVFSARLVARQITPQAVAKCLKELEAVGLVKFYQMGGIKYLELTDLYRVERCDRRKQLQFPQRLTNGIPNDNHAVYQTDTARYTVGYTPESESESESESVRESDTFADENVRPPSPDQDETVLSFPTRGGHGPWSLKRAKVIQYEATYPDLDVLAEIKLALQWVVDNQLKTFKGMPAYLNRWLGRAQDQLREPSRFGQPRPEQKCRPLTREEMLADDD